MISPRRTLALAVAMALAFSTSGCESDARVPEARAILIDVSGSFAGSSYGKSWQLAVKEDVLAMDGPGPITLRGFSGQVGGEDCLVPREMLTWDNNTVKFQDDKGPLAARILAAAEPYFACLEEKVTEKSSDVLGALNQVMDSDLAGEANSVRSLLIFSDGCQRSDILKLCSAKKLTDAQWRAATIEALPAFAKPEMLGVQVCFIGLGAGSKLEQSRVAALREFYAEYFQTVGATVDFSQGTTCQTQ